MATANTVTQRLDEIAERVDRHDYLLHGNGSPGMASDVRALLEARDRSDAGLEKLDARCARIERFMYAASGVLVAAKFVLELVRK